MGLHVQESGPTTAPAIVFLHGGGVSGWSWRPHVAQLPDYHCLVPDLPEHGRSLDVKPFSMQAAAAHVAELIRDRAPGGRAHVVGLSLGAQTAVQLLSIAPEVVDHALISGTLVRSIPGLGLVNLMTRMYMPFKNMNVMIRANMKQLGVPDAYFADFKADTRLLTTDSFTHVTTANMTFRIPPGLNRVTAPVLVVVGQKEPKVMRQSANDLVAAIPGAQGRIVAGVGHNWSLETSDLFTQTVRAWITDQPLPERLTPLTV